MKSYKTFGKEIVKDIEKHYEGSADVSVSEVLKNNGKKMDGISISFIDNSAVPVIYIEAFYDEYKQGKLSIEECAEKIISIREKNRANTDINRLTDMLADWEQVKENVYPQLVNTANNKELLNSVVNEPFLDLSIIYVIRGNERKGEGYSIKMTKELFDHLKISYETLKEQAIDNLKKEHYHVESMESVIERMMCGISAETEEETEIEPGGMYVMSNRSGMFGAAGLLNKEFLKRFKENNMYVIPSSIHELILIPDNKGIDVEDLTNMIREVNSNCVADTDILADHPYYYDCTKMEVQLCA